MALWVATPKDIGFSAFHTGNLRCQNPYEPGSEDNKLWFEGWDQAESIHSYTNVAEIIFPDTPGECVGCGSKQYTLKELNLRPDQQNRCYACTSASRYQAASEYIDKLTSKNF